MSNNIIEERKKYVVPGLSVFMNLGNTCYMNSIFQTLCNTPHIVAYFYKEVYKDELQEDKEIEFSEKMTNLMKHYWNESVKINLSNMKKILGEENDEFSSYKQNDCHEMFVTILNKIEDELACKNDYFLKKFELDDMEKSYLDCYEKNEIVNQQKLERALYKKKMLSFYKKVCISDYIFDFAYIKKMECSVCKFQSISYEVNKLLDLYLYEARDKNKLTLEELMEINFKPELMNGKNQCECRKCDKKRDSTKTISIMTCPNILAITIHRLYTNYETFITKKLDNEILFDKTFTLNGQQYELYSFICHKGSENGGHYNCYCKNMINNEWYDYDDTTLYHIDDIDEKIKRYADDVYMIFYKKLN